MHNELNDSRVSKKYASKMETTCTTSKENPTKSFKFTKHLGGSDWAKQNKRERQVMREDGRVS